MPFQIRRGTDAERAAITPAAGEPIFTTDTRNLYVGDGTTQGGIRVSGDIPDSLDDLSDVNIPSLPSDGEVLTWNGAAFVAQALPEFVVEGTNYRINIVADDSTVMVDTASQQLRGDLIGDVAGNVEGDVTGDLTGNVIGNLTGDVTGNFTGAASGSFTGDVFADIIRVRDTIINDASTILYDINTNTFFGNFDGDFSGGVQSGNIILNGQMYGGDSTLLIDSETNQFYGDINGAVKGSVFLDDSTPIVDGTNGTITANGFIQFGSYTAGERPSGANGMVIYNSTANRFQGFQNGGWINLDDGSGA